MIWTIMAFMSIFFGLYFLGMCVGSDDNPFATIGLILMLGIMIVSWIGHMATYTTTNQDYEWYIIAFGLLFYLGYSALGFISGYIVGRALLDW